MSVLSVWEPPSPTGVALRARRDRLVGDPWWPEAVFLSLAHRTAGEVSGAFSPSRWLKDADGGV